jgi:hypothetical protein
MNGRSSAKLFSFRFQEPRAAANLVSSRHRMLAALSASCLLHAALVCMPYLGASAKVFGPGLQGTERPVVVHILDATRVPENESQAVLGTDVGPENEAHSPPGSARDGEPRPAPDRALGADLLPIIPAPTYYTADQLTVRPRPVSAPRLNVPGNSPMFDSGKAILRVWISEFGHVVSVDAEESDLPEEVSAAAAAAFGKVRFVRGEINGRRVSALMRIEVAYEGGVLSVDGTRRTVRRRAILPPSKPEGGPSATER